LHGNGLTSRLWPRAPDAGHCAYRHGGGRSPRSPTPRPFSRGRMARRLTRLRPAWSTGTRPYRGCWSNLTGSRRTSSATKPLWSPWWSTPCGQSEGQPARKRRFPARSGLPPLAKLGASAGCTKRPQTMWLKIESGRRWWSCLLQFNQSAGEVFGVQKQHRLAMRADLGFAQNPCALGFQMIAGDDDIIHLVADVMNAAWGVLFQEACDGRGFSQRGQQFNLGIGQGDKHHRDAMRRFVLNHLILLAI